MTNTLYGIENCATMKKARAWLDANDIEYFFHDYKPIKRPVLENGATLLVGFRPQAYASAFGKAG